MAAEARAAGQRTANRCFVQEDAKRAPKLACSPSSSSSSKHQVDARHIIEANEPEHPTAGFMPLNWNPLNSNLPPDTKWWLQPQPNFGCQNDFTDELLNASEAKLEFLRAEEVSQTSKFGGDPPLSKEDSTHVDNNKTTGSSLDPQWRVYASCTKHDLEARMQEVKGVNSNNTQQPLKHKDIGESWYNDVELIDLDPVDRLISKKTEKVCFDLESPWMGGEQTEPWWRTADKDELASLVAQKSIERIENCDLPPVQTIQVRRGPFSFLENFEHDDIFISSSDRKVHADLCNPTDYARDSPTCGSVDVEQWASGDGHSLNGSDRAFSSSSTNSHSTMNKDPTEVRQTSESGPSKAQLLEALRHSQTRAREAEKKAQQAYSEKEHIVKLIFRQASHLFAYKQWLQLLQLETICLQLKNKDQPISTLFPVVLPWMPYKSRQLKKGRQKDRKEKQGLPRCDISKCTVALAVGLGLAGAGLLLGWTIGWVLPMF